MSRNESACHRNTAARLANADAGEHGGYLLPLVTEGPEPGLFPDPDVPFPTTTADLKLMTEHDLEALERFYGQRFGAPNNSLDYRRAVFAAFIGDVISHGQLKRTAFSNALNRRINPAAHPHMV